MNIVPACDSTVVPFSGSASSSMKWNALSMGNAAAAASGALAHVAPALDDIAEFAATELKLAQDARELSAILGQLAQDIGALRQRLS